MRLLILSMCALFCAPAQSPDALRRAFENPPADSRIMMRWWWFGPAVTDAELERELVAMKRGGIGGFEIQPVYPVMLDDPAYGIKTLPYLSKDYLDRLRFVSVKAAELGLRLNITLGSGWPFGGPHVPVTEAAGKLRIEYVPVIDGMSSVPAPDIESGEKLEGIFLANGDRRTFAAESLKQLPNTTAKRVAVPAAAGKSPRVAIFFISSRTGQQVKRAAVGAEGFVLDHYDRAAIDRHLTLVADKLAQALGSHPPYSVFSDSLEVYGSDWTPTLLGEFRKRRGYDLTPYLPALVADIGPDTAAIRHDWGMTLTELSEENYLTPLTNWAKLHRTKFRSQTYGIPPVRLSSNALVDLPEGEGYQWRRFTTSRWASSGSHLYGIPVTSSETWTWLHSPVFAATPLDMKSEADLHFLQGINQLVGHGWPYSPPEAGEPGWRFYAAAVFNDHNPWYMVMPDLSKYLQRVSFLLRQGKPANDVALYLPTDDAWAHFIAGRNSINQAMEGMLGDLVPRILDAGFNFDCIDDLAIEKKGIEFPVLILPDVDRIALASYRRIEAFAKKGGVVLAVGRVPSLAPGLKDAGDSPRIEEISQRLFSGAGAVGHVVGEQDLARFFTPDVRLEPKTSEIGVVHRKVDANDVYFLANTGNQSRTVKATFRVGGLAAQWWDPFTGKVSGAEIVSSDAKTTTVSLELAPYDSRVIVFGDAKMAPEPKHVSHRDPIDVSGKWEVAFAGGKTVTMDKLRSWTDDESTRYFSGIATYTKTVTVPETFLSGASEVWLDFGAGTPIPAQGGANARYRALLNAPVREAAMVTVNGKPAGSVWRPPYAVEIKPLLHSGENRIEIAVGNLAVNTMTGQAAPNYKLLNLRYTERFTPQDVEGMQPMPAGLLGKIELR